jgi:hypothetical protein
MGRPVNRQKEYFVDAVREILTGAKKLAGAEVTQEDPSTLVVEMPSTLGPGPRYSITIREKL